MLFIKEKAMIVSLNYELDFTDHFLDDIEAHRKSGDKTILKKIDVLLEELRVHPTTGTGKPHTLKGEEFKGQWSRRITGKHRLVYKIEKQTICILMLSAYGHYGD